MDVNFQNPLYHKDSTWIGKIKNAIRATWIGQIVLRCRLLFKLAVMKILNPPAGKKDYLSILQEYPKVKDPATELLTSLIEDIAQFDAINDRSKRAEALRYIAREGSFIDLIFTLDKDGNLLETDAAQSGPSDEAASKEVIFCGPYMIPKSSPRAKRILENLHAESHLGNSFNHSRKNRTYFKESIETAAIGEVVVTPPYTSVCTKSPCISAALILPNNYDPNRKILVIDADVSALLDFFHGEHRVRFFEQTYTQGVWLFLFSLTLIGISLFIGGVFDFILAIWNLLKYMLSAIQSSNHSSFDATELLNVLVTITVVMAIADLVKTLFEEEIVFYKDINKPSPARRTVIRFMTAILIALSIETLVLVFKSSHKTGHGVSPTMGNNGVVNSSSGLKAGTDALAELSSVSLEPIYMLFGVTALLVGLAVFTALTGWLEHVREQASTSNDIRSSKRE